MGIRTIPCIFGEKKNQEALISFVSVFVCKNVIGKEGKCVENIQAARTRKFSFFSFSLEVPGAFYSLSTLYEVVHLVGPPHVKLLKGD